MKPIELLNACLLTGSMKYLEKGTGSRYLYWFYYPKAKRYYYDYKLCLLAQIAGKVDFFTKLRHFETCVNLNVEQRPFSEIIPTINEAMLSCIALESLHYDEHYPFLKIVSLSDSDIILLKKTLDDMGFYCQIIKCNDSCKIVFTRRDVYDRIAQISYRELPMGTWSSINKKNCNIGLVIDFNNYQFVLDILNEALPEDYYLYHIFYDQFSVVDNFGIEMGYFEDAISEKTSEMFIIHNLSRKFFNKDKVCAIGAQTNRIADCCRDFGANIISFVDTKIKSDYFVDFATKGFAVRQLQDILKEINDEKKKSGK